MPDHDIGALAESIGNDLFGEGASVAPADNAGEDSVAPDSTPAALSLPVEALPDIPLPKSWKKEKESLWSKMDREAREYIQTRETDYLKGFEQYSANHKRWQELTEPFNPLLQQYPDVNPVQLMQNLMRNHVAIVQATPEQKKTLAQNLLKSYGIDLTPAQAQAVANQASLPPEFHQVQQELGSVKQALQSFQQAQYQQSVAEQAKTVEAFASDPKNKYFDKVGDDILRFIKTGAAQDLASAYELACYANPEVRALIIADQQSANKPALQPTPTNLNGSAEGTPSRRKSPTIDETINSVIQKNYPTH